MRTVLYNFFVNRHAGISYRYHKVHDGSSGVLKALSWAYLLLMNFAYYILFMHFLAKKPGKEAWDDSTKKLNVKSSESVAYMQEKGFLSPGQFVEKLLPFDVVSFDIFDTLILRSLSIPADVFYLIGEKIGMLDFKNIRIWAESDARFKCFLKNGHYEVTLSDIWKNLSEDTGLDADAGMELEKETELGVCFANPFMLEVFGRLKMAGKKIIITSDMYLSKMFLETLLCKNGFDGYDDIFVSCEYAKSKADGSLYRTVKEKYKGHSICHVGDNEHSDVKQARKNGISALHYQNVNKYTLMYRPFDMSAMVGSAYRAMVNNHLYNGMCSYSLDYEYGYVYGGLFVTGYCSFIKKYCEKNGVDKVLFLSRDGDIVKKVYDHLYPSNNSEYVYWSRKPAVKLMAAFDRHDFFRRFIYHKINQGISIGEALDAMDLHSLKDNLKNWKNIFDEYEAANPVKKPSKFIDLREEDKLSEKNGYLLRRFIEYYWDCVLNEYNAESEAAKTYYSKALAGCRKAVAVDIGWAGSGAVALSVLCKKAWNIPCEITGIVAGTNTVHNAEPDASEAFLQNGSLVSYMFSQSFNRDIMKKHDLNRDYNIFWEIILSSPTKKFDGFGFDDGGNVELRFGKEDYNSEGMKEIQKGILDFAREYKFRFEKFPYMFNISGRDAYAPVLLASGHNEKYLKMIENRYKLEIGV